MTQITPLKSPTEIDHYQIQRVDRHLRQPGRRGSRPRSPAGIRRIIAGDDAAGGRARRRARHGAGHAGVVHAASALGLILALVLLYLILVAQFRSFIDPLLILLAVPTGLTGVLLALYLTGTTLNVQSLMGVVMMVGMVVSNSILIVEFTHRLQEDGMPLLDAVVSSCRIRLRPILMTSLATVFGLIPMALKLGTGSEAYAPLARAIIGGLHRLGRAHGVHRAGRVSAGLPPARPTARWRRRRGHEAASLCLSPCAGAARGGRARVRADAAAAVAAGRRAARARRTIPQIRAAQYARRRRRSEIVRETRVGLLPDGLRQRHRRGGARTAAASPPAA